MQVNFKYTSQDSLVFSFFVKALQKCPQAASLNTCKQVFSRLPMTTSACQNLCSLSMYRVNIDQRPLFISSLMNEGHPSLFPEIISSSLATAFNSKPNMGMEYKRGSFKTRITKTYIHTKHKRQEEY